MPLKHGILGLLNYGPSTGYDLDKVFKGSLNFFWQAQTSQIYRELNVMEKLGWITSEKIVQSDKPNKKVFSINPSGKEELFLWLSKNSVQEDIRIRDPFLVKLFFSGEIDVTDNIETLKQFMLFSANSLEEIKETLAFCNIASETDKNAIYWGTTASFGQYYYEMCIRWAEDTIKKLEKLK